MMNTLDALCEAAAGFPHYSSEPTYHCTVTFARQKAREAAAARNRMLVMFKPECFRALDDLSPVPHRGQTQLSEVLHAWDRLLRQTDSHVLAVCLFNGAWATRGKLYATLYQTLAKVSMEGTSALHLGARQALQALLPTDKRALGGHQLLARSTLSAKELQVATDRAGTEKFGANLYLATLHLDGRDQHVINGFSPYQQEHLERTPSTLGACVVDTPLRWPDARGGLVGHIDPRLAAAGSLRRLLYEARLHSNPWDIAHNGAHISAGPFEAISQISQIFPAAAAQELVAWDNDDLALIQRNPLVTRAQNNPAPLYEVTELVETNDAYSLFDDCRARGAIVLDTARPHRP
ncbi:MAG: hypothetical protein EOO40_00910 [Deltaproteobacteria bacterium]|nr:MAG: hypothetical protein EOO40_00910 [Deltaproteobacteria bacterium]